METTNSITDWVHVSAQHTSFAAVGVWQPSRAVGPQTRLETYGFCERLTACGYGEKVCKEGFCAAWACGIAVRFSSPGCVWGDKGIPSGGWSVPAPITAVCRGLILSRRRRDTCRMPSLCITEGLFSEGTGQTSCVATLPVTWCHTFLLSTGY